MQQPAERWYGLLLRCYPAEFRDRFETGMHETLRREYADARARGSLALFRFWLLTSFDAVRFGCAERRPRFNGDFSMKSLFVVDLRDALRSLRASPVITVVAILSLALGIGANTALFSILNSLLLKTLPVHDPARLAIIDEGSWTNPIWEQIRERRSDLFEDAFAWSGSRMNLSAHGETDFVEGAWASGGMFDVLGVKAALGRTFTAADDVRGGGPDGPVAVVSYGFWERRMGAAPDAVGRRLTVDGLPVTVIGVMPRGFLGPDVGRSADVVVPIGALTLVPGQGRMLDGRSTWWLEIMTRLKPGQTIEDAEARLNGVRPQIREATLPQDWDAKNQAEYLREPLKLVPAATGQSSLRSSYQKPLQIVLVVVGAVLVIACANLANLLLARAASRRHELGVRLALGASRFRLAKQLLAETGILALAGAGLGLVVAKWAGPLLVRQLATPSGGVTLDLSLDWRVLAFTAAVTAATTLVFGIAPALGVSRISAGDAIKEQTRTVTGDRRFGLRNALVAVQVALSLALVVGGLLFVRTLSALNSTALGFNAEALIAASVDAREIEDAHTRLQVYGQLLESAAAIPGVSGAALSALTPVGSMRWNTLVEPTPAAAGLSEKERAPWVNVVSPGWFRTFEMRLLQGRDFDARDTAQAPRVLIVSESFARRFFGSADPVGQEVRAGLEGPAVHTFRIVGVVGDSVYSSIRKGFEPTIYVPLAQLEDMLPSVVVTARAANGRPETLSHDLSATLARVDPRIAFTIRPVSSQLRASVRQERLVAMLAGFFGMLALLLAAIGLYGVASHSVTRRRAEIGIRMALGAEPERVVRLVLGRLVWLLVVGMVLGVALSWWSVKLLDQLMFGLQARDPLTFALAATVLLVAGLLAGWLPARRAARIDPVQALREA
jgi:predicted permease